MLKEYIYILGERRGIFCIPNDRWACIRNWKHCTWGTGVTMKGYITYCKSLDICLAAVCEASWHGIINGVTFTAVIVNYCPFQWNIVIPCHFILKFLTQLLQCSLLKRHISGSSYLMSQLSGWHFCFTFSTSRSGLCLEAGCLGW